MLTRKTPMKAGSKPLARGTSTMKRSAMKPGSVPMKRAAAPMRARSKTNANPRPATGEAKLCKGQPCYLLIAGICTGQAHDPCHSNQAIHGKGGAIKAHDEFTVPGCRACHNELDQGKRFTREQKFALWDSAYARWKPVRAQLLLERAPRRQTRPPSSASVGT